MAQSFSNWKDARNAATLLARQLGRETGIEKMNQFGKEVFLVHHLPKPENRYGFELRCEVVKPDDPLAG